MPHGALLRATRQAVQAAGLGDLVALQAALAARRAAIANASESERIAALKEGESIHFLLRGIKRRLANNHQRLEQLKSGLGGAPLAAMIDYRA